MPSYQGLLSLTEHLAQMGVDVHVTTAWPARDPGPAKVLRLDLKKGTEQVLHEFTQGAGLRFDYARSYARSAAAEAACAPGLVVALSEDPDRSYRLVTGARLHSREKGKRVYEYLLGYDRPKEALAERFIEASYEAEWRGGRAPRPIFGAGLPAR